MNLEPVGNPDTSSPEDDNSFHTPEHSQWNKSSIWNFIASQDSIDVFHDAQSSHNKIPSKRNFDANTQDYYSSCNTIAKGPLARIRHCSHGSKSCNTSPSRKPVFCTTSLRRPDAKEVLQDPHELELLQSPKMAPEHHNNSTSTQTNDWMKNYVPYVGLEAFLYSDVIKSEDVEHTALLHGSSKITTEPFSPKKIRRQKRCCLHRLKDEFRLVNFKLQHSSPHLFVTSQWQKTNGMSCWYLGYRLFWGVYFCLWSVWSCAGYKTYDIPTNRVYYFIYLTHWCMWMLALDTMLQATNVIMHMKKVAGEGTGKYSRMKTSFHISWVLSNITSTLHLFTTIVFWSFIAPTKEDPFSLIGIHTHILPCIYVLLDLLISATPRRILHSYQPMIFLTLYGIFTDIYYLAGGTTREGFRAIYSILDWSKPAETLLFSSGLVLVLVPLLHIFVCLVCALRIKLATRFKVNRFSSEDVIDEVVHHSTSREEKV